MFNISMFFYLFNCIKMNKNFLFLLFIILIVGIIVFVYNYKDISQKIKEFFEENYLDNFKFELKDYTFNNIIPVNPEHNYTSSGTNYFEIKDFNLDTNKIINNTIFTKFFKARTILNEELKDKNENFIINNNVIIGFAKIDNFLEIQFNFGDTTQFLKLTINSTGPTTESIKMERDILINDTRNTDLYEKSNTDKYITGISFQNQTMKKYDYIKSEHSILNVFFITLTYSNNTQERLPTMIIKLEDGITKPDGTEIPHFCKDLLNVSVYSNPLNKSTTSNNIKVSNLFLVQIYIEKNQPLIKSKRTDDFDVVAFTHKTGKIFRPTIEEKDKGKYASLGDYMYDSETKPYKKVPAWKKALLVIGTALLGLVTGGAGFVFGAAIGGAATTALKVKGRNNIAYKNLRDALLLNIDGKYVIPAENVGYMWDDDFINLNGRKKNTFSEVPAFYNLKKRTNPLVLFNLLPVSKDGFVYYPIGNFAYVGPLDNNSFKNDLLNWFRKNRKYNKKYPNANNYVFKDIKGRMNGQDIPHVLVREDCIDFTAMPKNHGPHMIWWDAGGPGPSSLDGSASSYWVKYINFTQAQINDANTKNSDNGGYRNDDVNNPGDFLALFNGSHSKVSGFNYQIKKEALTRQDNKEYDIETKKATIIGRIKKAIQDIPNITQPPIIRNTNDSPDSTEINKEKIDSQSKYTANLDFNKKMENIQKDYNYNFSYITEINSQLSDIRQKEKIFVENQIKQQLESNKTKIQEDVKKQTEKLNKYDTDISDTSKIIGNQINEYVVLRKHRELMPTNPQVMF